MNFSFVLVRMLIDQSLAALVDFMVTVGYGSDLGTINPAH